MSTRILVSVFFDDLRTVRFAIGETDVVLSRKDAEGIARRILEWPPHPMPERVAEVMPEATCPFNPSFS